MSHLKTSNQWVPTANNAISLFVKREDLIHPLISGNKYRKLKYNLARATAEGFKTLLTFGGAYSNHIAAVAAAGREFGFRTIGVIRGEELAGKIAENPTLQLATDNGMEFEFVSRETYRHKDKMSFLEDLESKYGGCYFLPEGGTNELAIQGCKEILTSDDVDFDYICCAVGTGGTIAGIIESAGEHQLVLGFAALKGSFLKDSVSAYTAKDNWEMIPGYEFGGYGKITAQLVAFMNDFYKQTAIPLDPVYTSKLLFGVLDLIDSGFFPDGSKILAVHTGGIQGVAGMNVKLKFANLPLIRYDD